MNSSRRLVSWILLVAVAVTQSGCSMVVSRRQTLSIMTSEDDADIYVNGEYVGQGRIQMRVPRNKDLSVMVKKEGYRTAVRSVGTEISGTGVADLLGGYCFLLPFIGMLFPGSRSLEETSLSIPLERAPAPPAVAAAPPPDQSVSGE